MMRIHPTKTNITLIALIMGMIVPIFYFGLQIAAAPFYPGYNFLSQTASELGSNQSAYASTFNIGIIILGIVTLIAALGCLQALLRLGINPILSWLTAIAIAANGVSSIWAGTFPLPDPKHAGLPIATIGIILFPFLLTAALWKRKDISPVKIYLIISILMILAIIPLMSGAVQIDINLYRGLIQRIFAVATFGPIGIGAYFLAKSLKNPMKSQPSI
jgi:hypothetical membrane protein